MATDRYESPLGKRYGSREMQWIFSDDRKFIMWRKLWLELARAQKQLGIARITDEQLVEMEMEDHLTVIDYAWIAAEEKRVRHDVVAHLHGFGRVCPRAASIMHLGATSTFVTDNTDLIMMRDALQIICGKIACVMQRLAHFANNHRYIPTLGYTHFQSAQPVTVGKRACMWLQDFLMDLKNLERVTSDLRFLGVKGATGTQASFVALFDGNLEKVDQLDALLTKAFGFVRSFTVTGQTYTRKVDVEVLAALAGLGTSVHKMETDLRLLQHMGEIEEPFEEDQVGSSAMAYKRNPMRGERACSLARHLVGLLTEALMTHQVQWLERTLDDSAGRRIYIPEAFLTADAILAIVQNVIEGLKVYAGVMMRRVEDELPLMKTEEILIAMVGAGKDRQECHEMLRTRTGEAAVRMKNTGERNDLMARLLADPYFAPVRPMLTSPPYRRNFIGRAPEQVEQFLREEVAPALQRYAPILGGSSELSV